MHRCKDIVHDFISHAKAHDFFRRALVSIMARRPIMTNGPEWLARKEQRSGPTTSSTSKSLKYFF